MLTEEKYMKRALELAKKGIGMAAPNPSVGAVIVYNQKIIGEGYTSSYGGPHAEVNAINSVINKELLIKSTIYVTLEPCSHHGKTPPCADLIIKNHIPKVVIGLLDPHDKVSGRGIRKLEDAGCSVEVGVLKKECTNHHKRFLTYQVKKRPYIILKWAQTKNGFIAPSNNERKEKAPVWITNSQSRQLVHKWRSEEQAILVGTNTVLKDNPKLNVRSWHGKSPIRIILDKELALLKEHHVLDESQPTIILTQVIDTPKSSKVISYEFLDFKKNIAQQICSILHNHHITSVLIEGGAKTFNLFIKENLWDEARVFTGNTMFKEGIKAPKLSASLVKTEILTTDTLNTYTND